MARSRSTPARNVRVYTVNDESRYVVARNIPAVGAVDEALKRLSLYGEIEAHRVLPRSAADEASFTDSVWVQYETVNNARHAKAKAKLKPVVGSVLDVAYAPQHETPEDTARKLRERRELLERRAMPRPRPPQRHSEEPPTIARREASTMASDAEFIGPQLPPPSYRRSEGTASSATTLVPRALDRSKRRRI